MAVDSRKSKRTPGKSSGLALLSQFANADDEGVIFDKRIAGHQWLIDHGYVYGKIKQPSAASDWPEIRLRLTDYGREQYANALAGPAAASSRMKSAG